jgi:hypothetical protein
LSANRKFLKYVLVVFNDENNTIDQIRIPDEEG